ncbi:MAG TPA: hypothetical protein VGB50_10115, partial [Flavobacterium sp.]
GLTFKNGGDSFDFYVGATGNNPFITDIDISGHPQASMELLKEFSDAMVRCYEGEFSGGDSGVFNLIIFENEIYGLAKGVDDDGPFYVEGIINDDNTVTGSFEGGAFSGELNGNNIGGIWQNIVPENGNWNAHRTL